MPNVLVIEFDLGAERAEFAKYSGPNVELTGIRMLEVEHPTNPFAMLECDVTAHGHKKVVGHRVDDPGSVSARISAARECGRGAAMFSNLVRP